MEWTDQSPAHAGMRCACRWCSAFQYPRKNATLPDKVPVLRFTEELPDLEAIARAVVVYTCFDDFHDLVQRFFRLRISAIYFKNEIAAWHYSDEVAQSWSSFHKTTRQSTCSPNYVQRSWFRQSTKLTRFSWSKWFRFLKELGLCQHHRRSWRS